MHERAQGKGERELTIKEIADDAMAADAYGMVASGEGAGDDASRDDIYLGYLAAPIREVVAISARRFGVADASSLCFGDGDSDTRRARDIAIFALRRYLLMGWEGIALIFNCNEPWARARCDAALDMIIKEPRYGSVIDEIRGALDC